MTALWCGPALASCGGQGGGANYARFDCGGQIGSIVRDDCGQSAIKYDGKLFEGSANTTFGGASVKTGDMAVREASELVQLLNQQAMRLCNDFNSCRLTVPEYNAERRRLDDSYVALTALKGQMAQLDAEQASKLLGTLSKIRSQAIAGPAGNGCPEAVEIPFTKDPQTECSAPWSEGVTTCIEGGRLRASWNGAAGWQGFGVPLRPGWAGFMDLTKHRGCSLVLRLTGVTDEVHVIIKGQECEKQAACNQSGPVPLGAYRRPTGEFRIPLSAFEGGSLPMFAAKQIMFGTWQRKGPVDVDIYFPLRIE